MMAQKGRNLESEMRDNTANNRRWRKRNPAATKAHSKVDTAKRAGRLKKQPCEVCGNPRASAHHDDYSKPLQVRWLCHDHHVETHHGSTPKVRVNRNPRYRKPSYHGQLPELAARATEMRREGKGYQEIATVLGVSKGTVYKWINQPKYR